MTLSSQLPAAPATATAAVSTIRGLIIDMIENAGCGHPGAALALAPLGYALYHDVLRGDPAAPDWPDRDRLVLSAGHASALQYTLLHVTGYDLTRDDLRAFRRLGSRTPGHPEHGVTPGVEATTGPLGQGLATAVGMALAERLLAERFNRPGLPVVDHHTVVIASDGDLMEGVSQEAISLAGQLGLGKLIVCYDSNGVTIDGHTSLTFDAEDQAARFAASGWQVERAPHFDDPAALAAALRRIRDRRDGRPSLLILETVIGHPAAAVAGSPAAHGGALGPAEARRTKEALGLDPDATFAVTADVAAHLDRRAAGADAHRRWRVLFDRWSTEFPELRREWDRCYEPAPDADGRITAFDVPELSPRNASREIMDRLDTSVPGLAGGAADLVDSTKTAFGAASWFTAARPGRNIAYGVREHAMAAATNGLALHGGVVKPYASTFLSFGDYMRPAVRLSAIMRLPLLWIWTHDSVAIGSDGPTHQPVEHLAGLRAMPHLWVMRPADANETAWCWRPALRRADGPVAFVLARQPLPVLAETRDRAADVARGGYVLWASGGRPGLLLIASGSEVHPALDAGRALAAEGVAVRVVSLPCWELFAAQDQAYRDEVLPPGVVTRLGVEAGSSFGWHRWVGPTGDIVAMDEFGASDDGDVLQEHFGFTVGHVLERARHLLAGAKEAAR